MLLLRLLHFIDEGPNSKKRKDRDPSTAGAERELEIESYNSSFMRTLLEPPPKLSMATEELMDFFVQANRKVASYSEYFHFGTRT
jgi:hypothetical protein